MIVKLDLHTHIWEACNFQPPSLDIAEKVIAQVKSQRIDGIAITDHHNKAWAFEFRELVERHFSGEMIVIPGWEIEVRPPHSPFDEYQVAEAVPAQRRNVPNLLPSRVLLAQYHHRGKYPRHRDR